MGRNGSQASSMKLHCLESGSLLEKDGKCHAVGKELLGRLFQSKAGEVESILEGVKTANPGEVNGRIFAAGP